MSRACRNVQRLRGELVSKAHRRLHHSTLGLRVINQRRRSRVWGLKVADNLFGRAVAEVDPREGGINQIGEIDKNNHSKAFLSLVKIVWCSELIYTRLLSYLFD